MYCTVLGIQRSGTNYLETLLTENFSDVSIQNQRTTYVWKHHAYPNRLRRTLSNENRIHFLIFKNPYKWVESLIRYNGDLSIRYGGRKRQHYFKYRLRRFNDIIIKDRRGRTTNLRGALDLYSCLYTNWLSTHLVRIIPIQYEKLLIDDFRESFLFDISKEFSLNARYSYFVNPTNIRQSEPMSAKRKRSYLNQSSVQMLSDDHIELVNQRISDALFRSLGYKKINAFERI